MKVTIHLLLTVVLLVFSSCRKAVKEEIPLPLTEEEIKESIEYGAKNASLSFTEFTADWTVGLGYGKGKGNATLITPYLRLSLLSKQLSPSGEKPDAHMIDMVVKEDIEFLNFEVTLYGSSPEFARNAKFLLKYKSEQIHPSYSFMPPYSEIARDYTQRAKGRVKFKKEGIPEDATVILVASFQADEEAEETSVCEFVFDLSEYK
jgi:hypothetical protein